MYMYIKTGFYKFRYCSLLNSANTDKIIIIIIIIICIIIISRSSMSSSSIISSNIRLKW